MTPDMRELIRKLHSLLDEYNATIMFEYDGDTYGVFDERTEISIGIKDKQVVYFSYLDKHNLKEILDG